MGSWAMHWRSSHRILYRQGEERGSLRPKITHMRKMPQVLTGGNLGQWASVMQLRPRRLLYTANATIRTMLSIMDCCRPHPGQVRSGQSSPNDVVRIIFHLHTFLVCVGLSGIGCKLRFVAPDACPPLLLPTGHRRFVVAVGLPQRFWPPLEGSKRHVIFVITGGGGGGVAWEQFALRGESGRCLGSEGDPGGGGVAGVEPGAKQPPQLGGCMP